MTTWLGYFTVTVAVETLVVASLLRVRGIAPGALVAKVILANLLTHPLLYAWLYVEQDPRRSAAIFLSCELLLVPLVEGLLYAKEARLKLREAIGISYIANAASCCAGLVVWALSSA